MTGHATPSPRLSPGTAGADDRPAKEVDMSRLVRYGIALAVMALAFPGAAQAAEVAAKAVCACCGGLCPLGCC